MNFLSAYPSMFPEHMPYLMLWERLIFTKYLENMTGTIPALNTS